MSVDSVPKGLACKELIRFLWRVIENTKACAKAQADWDRIEIGKLVEMMRPLWVAIGIEPGLSIGDKTLFKPFDGRTILITFPGTEIAFGSQSYWLKIVDPDTGTLRYLMLKSDHDDSRATSADNVSDLMHVAEAWIHWIENHADDAHDDQAGEPVTNYTTAGGLSPDGRTLRAAQGDGDHGDDDRILPSDGLSEDGRTLRWGGDLYPLSPTAAGPVKKLVDSFQCGFPYLSETHLRDCERGSEMRTIVRDNGLNKIVVKQQRENGTYVKDMWGLIDPKKVS